MISFVADSTEAKGPRGGGAGAKTGAPHILIQSDPRARDPITRSAPLTAWRLFGWFGLLLVLIGGLDVVSQWYPTSFKSPEWEFGTSALTIASLPLLTIGVVVFGASLMARGRRGGVIAVGAFYVLLFVAVGMVLVLFALDVPLALRAPAGPALTVVKKTILRTVVMGAAYEAAFLAAAVVSFRYAFGRIMDP